MKPSQRNQRPNERPGPCPDAMRRYWPSSDQSSTVAAISPCSFTFFSSAALNFEGPRSMVTLLILPANLLSPSLYSSETAVSPSIPTSAPSSAEKANGCVLGMCPSATFLSSTNNTHLPPVPGFG